MTGTVTIHVHAGYRQVHLLLGVEAIAADPPYPPGQVVTAGELTMPAARFDPDRLVARCPRAAWEAWWDDPGTGGRYAAFHPQHGPLAGEHRDRWLAYPLTTGWDWDVPGEQLAVIRSVFAEAAARARADVVADALAGQDPDHRYAHINELAASRARVGGVVVGAGGWVLTWDGGEGYTLETLDDTGAALSVLDKVSYATPAPTAALLYPWADAHAWTVPPTTANPRLADWLSQTWNSGGPAGGRPVALGPAAALGLVRPRTDPNAAVDGALFGQWAQAVTTRLPGCTLAAHTTGTQMWANDPDQAVVLGPPGTDLAAVRCAARAVTDALGWAGPTPANPARDLPAGALAAAATVVRAGLEYQVAAQAASSAAAGSSAAFLVALTTDMDAAAAAEAAARGLPAPNPQATRAGWARVVAHLGAGSGGEAQQQLVDAWKAGVAAHENASGSGGAPGWAEDHRRVGPARAAAQLADQARVGTWRAATGHGFTAEQIATLDGRTTAAQVHAALTTGAPVGDQLAARRRTPWVSALDPIRAALAEMTSDGLATAVDPPARRATPPTTPATAPTAPPPAPGSTGRRR